MSLIYCDSMVLIYWLENHPHFAPLVEAVIRKMGERGDRLCTGIFTVGEVLVGPYKKGKVDEIQRLSEYFASSEITLLAFDLKAVRRYAQIRAQYRISPADAIHLATASVAQVDLYLTNDSKLRSLVIEGIQFIAGLDGRIF